MRVFVLSGGANLGALQVGMLQVGMLQALSARGIVADQVVGASVGATTDLCSGDTRWWTRGPAVDVLAASACLPGVFPPVWLDGTLHIDGAVTQAVPVARGVEVGATELYVLDAGATAQAGSPPGSALDVVVGAFRAARLSRLALDRAAIGPATKVVWLPAVDVGRLAFDDFSQTRRLIDAGAGGTEAFLDTQVVAATTVA